MAAKKKTRLTLEGLVIGADESTGSPRIRFSAMVPDRVLDRLERGDLAAYGAAPRTRYERECGGSEGEFWTVLRPAYRQHWQAEAARLRGRRVRVEATVRGYLNAADQRRGYSLDLDMMEEVGSAGSISQASSAGKYS